MRHLSYGEKSVFVSDGVADALMELARVLSEEGRSETVTVDAVTETGHLVRVTLLLTPATGLIAESTDAVFALPADGGVVDALRARAARVRGTLAREFTERPPDIPGEFA